MNEPEVILDMLGGPGGEPRTIAVVGLSNNPVKPSFYVSEYMQKNGSRILPVNPALETFANRRINASWRLSSILFSNFPTSSSSQV